MAHGFSIFGEFDWSFQWTLNMRLQDNNQHNIHYVLNHKRNEV